MAYKRIADNPLRKRSWRWDRVVQLCAVTTSKRFGKPQGPKPTKPPQPGKGDDKYIREGLRYLREFKKRGGSIVRSDGDVDSRLFNDLYSKWSAISTAHRIYYESGFIRWAIEALVLAQQTPSDIADKLGCDPDTVDAYELYFYDVRDRMDHELFIVSELLSNGIVHGTTGDDYDFFWKGLAYWYGAPTLTAFWSLDTIDTNVKANLVDLVKSMAQRNIVKASVSRQITGYNAHEVMEESFTREQLDRSSEGSDASSTQAEEAAIGLLTSLKYSVSSIADIPKTPIEERIGKSIDEIASEALADVEGAVIEAEVVQPKSITPDVDYEPAAAVANPRPTADESRKVAKAAKNRAARRLKRKSKKKVS